MVAVATQTNEFMRNVKMRLDKWLWAARFFKTRSLAQKAIENGQVQVNEQRVKASREVGAGDVLRVEQVHMTRTLQITGLSARRGTAPEAECLYMETPDSRDARAVAEQQRTQDKLSTPDYGRRPDKRGRRQLLGLQDQE
jgi:ribosome-associated heat shock protein Hsp15